MDNGEEMTVSAMKLRPEDFRPFGQVVTLRDTRAVSDVPLKNILESKSLMGVPTVSTDAVELYDGVASLELGGPVSLSVVLVKQRPLLCDLFERHTKAPEAIIPLDGCGVMPFAPPRDLENPDAEPSLGEVKAFILDGSKAVILGAGVWHWVPYPLTQTATLLAVQRKGAYREDTFFKRAKKPLRLIIQ